MRACILIVTLLALGCGEDARRTDEKAPDPVPGDPQARTEAPQAPPHEHELAELSLVPIVPAVMTAPVTAKAETSPSAAARVSTPDGSFAVLIDAQPADVAARKADIQGNTVNELKEFLVDDDAALVYRTEAMPDQPEFHFLANVEVGGRTLSCRDETGPFWTREQIDLMLEACQSLEPAE